MRIIDDPLEAGIVGRLRAAQDTCPYYCKLCRRNFRAPKGNSKDTCPMCGRAGGVVENILAKKQK